MNKIQNIKFNNAINNMNSETQDYAMFSEGI